MVHRFLGYLFALLGCLWASFAAMAGPPGRVASRWHCCATENFLAYTTDSSLAQRLAQHCESKRHELAKLWLGEEAANSWNKCRCVVVVHPTAAAYATAVGRGGEQSSGCSTVRVNARKLVYRRIDLRADRGDPMTAALPHELTHVVLADRFFDQPLPRWADEGMAILADPLHKQQGHRRDAQLATLGRSSFTVSDLLQMVDYPPPTRQAAFYGQSAALVTFLVDRGGHRKLLDFVELSMTAGSDQALAKIYNIDSAIQLDRLWRQTAAEVLVAKQ